MIQIGQHSVDPRNTFQDSKRIFPVIRGMQRRKNKVRIALDAAEQAPNPVGDNLGEVSKCLLAELGYRRRRGSGRSRNRRAFGRLDILI